MVKNIFWNKIENRIRAGWRILATLAGMFIIFLPVQALLKLITPDSLTKNQKIDLLLAVFAVIATLVIRISRTRIDKRSFTSLGMKIEKGVFRDIAAGLIISAILVLIILTIEMSFGWVKFEFTDSGIFTIIFRILYMFIATGLVVAWWENLFFVSYLFINLKDGCGFWCAFILNCIIFGAIHSANPNASVWAFAGIVIIHSYEIFGFLRTKNLWLILGIHAGWNFFQGLAGFNVSGWTGNKVIMQTNTTPEWLGGGKFGPEAGAIILLTGVVAFGLIHLYAGWCQYGAQESE